MLGGAEQVNQVDHSNLVRVQQAALKALPAVKLNC